MDCFESFQNYSEAFRYAISQWKLANGTIAIGWRQMGDISGLNREELEASYRSAFGSVPAKGTVTRDVNALWSFYNEVLPGDVIIARRGTKRIVGIGTVSGTPFYDKREGIERVANLTDDYYPNFIPVDWEENDIRFDRIVFSFYTVYEIEENKYTDLLEDNDELPDDEGLQVEFVLEKYLEDFMVTNFDRIFQGGLELFVDPEGSVGRQYPAIGESGQLIGRIDILAKDPKSDTFLVIELKKGRESDTVVGQTLRYMGWVEENLCSNSEKVRGLIVCKDIDQKLAYALRMVGDIIDLKRYSVDFRLEDVNLS